jgi:hypothetical protein
VELGHTGGCTAGAVPANSAFFGFVFLGVVGGLVAPGVGLRSRHNPGNIGVVCLVTLPTRASARARFGSPRGLFLLLFGTSPLSLALAPRQWIPCSHLAIL